MFRHALAAFTFSSLLFSNNAWAQTPLASVGGKAPGDRFGSSVAGIGDMDGDGTPDWAVGSPHSDVNGLYSGSVVVISGATGVELYEFLGNSTNDLFGSSLAGADLNGDGFADLVVGAHGDDAGRSESGAIFVYSGQDGRVMYSRPGVSAGDNYGYDVDIVPDVDGDGLPDLIVGARTADGLAANSGQAQLLKGSNGAVLRNFNGLQAFDFFGKSVAGLEDVNGDGFGDVLIGAPGRNGGRGTATVFSGANGDLLLGYSGAVPNDGLGSAVASAGDLDGDGRGDFLLGVPGSDVAFTNGGLVRVFSGMRGRFLFDISGNAVGDYFGSALAGGTDLTGDGVPELIVGVPFADPNGTSSGQAVVYSGVDGSLVAALDGQTSGARYAGALACSADTNGDGVGELLVGAWGEDAGLGAFTGMFHVVTFATEPTNVVSYCTSSNNSDGTAAFMGHGGSTVVSAQDFEINVQGAIGNAPGLFFYGPSEANTPFGDGTLCVGGTVARLPAVTTDSRGQASLLIDYANPPIPSAVISAGSTWKFQFWYRDPAGVNAQFNLSNGLSVTFE